MLSKASLSRALIRAQRSFHSSSSVKRIVATNPVKAETVKVRSNDHIVMDSHTRYSSPGLQKSTH